jgi:hypothetical protein
MNRLTIMLLLLFCNHCAIAGVNAWLDRYHIDEGEVLRLTIEAEGDIPGDPNTDALLPDFEILGIANGHRQTRGTNGFINFTTWTISLKARHPGVLGIPALRIASWASPPLSVEVRPVKGTSHHQGEVFIQSEVSDATPWLQSMVLYTVRILYDIPMSEGRLSSPDVPNALVQQLKGDRVGSIELNGRRYKTIERRYALFPQRSGKLSIPAPVLDAKVPAATQAGRLDFSRTDRNPLQTDRGEFDTFITATRPIRVRGEATVLTVKPPAAGFSGRHWLPARSLVLTESPGAQQQALRTGDPITRSFTIRAEGLMAEQIPALSEDSDNRGGVYFDKPVRQNHIDAHGVVGTLIQRVVYVPREPGTLELPPLSVTWWDVGTQREKVAMLPAHSYTIVAAEDDPAATQVSTERAATDAAPKAAPATAEPDAIARQLPETGTWRWISGVLAMLWLLTLLFWRHERKQRGAHKRPLLQKKQPTNTHAKKRFHQACRENLAGPARQYLLEWARSHWPDDPPIGLEDLAARLDNNKLTPLLQQLDAAVYAGKKHKWRGRKLGGKLKKLPRTRTSTANINDLPPLYPD